MEKIHPGRYVIVNKSTGQVELKLTSGGTLAYLANDAEFAVLMGNVIQVNLKNGGVVFYKIEQSGFTVSGPYLSL